MQKVHPCSNTVNHGTKGVVILLSPNSCCWWCERKLPEQPGAVAVEVPGKRGLTDFVFLICSERCGRAVKPEIASCPGMQLNPRPLPPAEISVLLRVKANIVGVVEGWQGLDRPYYLFHGPFFDKEESKPMEGAPWGLN